MKYLNVTHLEHSIIAVITQLLLWLYFDIQSAGAIAVAIFIGREIAQHEYKERKLLGVAAKLPLFVGLYKHWSIDSVLDVVTPAISCSIVYLLVINFYDK